MARGRRPKSPDLRVIEGNRSRRAIPRKAPAGKPASAAAPAWLDPVAKGEWRRVAPELLATGVLLALDRVMLASYCATYARWRAAQDQITEHGLTYETTTINGRQVKANPAVAIAASASQQMRLLATEFGMTPASRSRVTATNPPDESGRDPWAS